MIDKLSQGVIKNRKPTSLWSWMMVESLTSAIKIGNQSFSLKYKTHKIWIDTDESSRIQLLQPRVSFHIDEWIIIIFSIKKLFLKVEIIYISIIYYNIIIWVVKLFNVTYDNYDDFQHVNFILSQKFHFTILRII